MKRILRIFFILSIICLTLIIQPEGVQAFPPLPSSFYGTVKINNTKVADGTLIEAVVNGKVFAQSYTQMYGADSVYTISIPGDDPSTTIVDGAKEGDVISFKVGGIAAQQTGTWHSGTNEQLDLSAVTSVTPNTPAPTPTSYPTQTAIPMVNTPVPTAAAKTPTLAISAMPGSEALTSTACAQIASMEASSGGLSITAQPGADQSTGKSPTVKDQSDQPGNSDQTEFTMVQKPPLREFLFIPLALIILIALGVFVWLLRKTLRNNSDE